MSIFPSRLKLKFLVQSNATKLSYVGVVSKYNHVSECGEQVGVKKKDPMNDISVFLDTYRLQYHA